MPQGLQARQAPLDFVPLFLDQAAQGITTTDSHPAGGQNRFDVDQGNFQGLEGANQRQFGVDLRIKQAVAAFAATTGDNQPFIAVEANRFDWQA